MKNYLEEIVIVCLVGLLMYISTTIFREWQAIPDTCNICPTIMGGYDERDMEQIMEVDNE